MVYNKKSIKRNKKITKKKMKKKMKMKKALVSKRITKYPKKIKIKSGGATNGRENSNERRGVKRGLNNAFETRTENGTQPRTKQLKLITECKISYDSEEINEHSLSDFSVIGTKLVVFSELNRLLSKYKNLHIPINFKKLLTDTNLTCINEDPCETIEENYSLIWKVNDQNDELNSKLLESDAFNECINNIKADGNHNHICLIYLSLWNITQVPKVGHSNLIIIYKDNDILNVRIEPKDKILDMIVNIKIYLKKKCMKH